MMVNIPTTNGKRPQETSAARARGVARPRCQGRPGECGPAGQSGRGDRPAAHAGDDQGDEGRAEDERRGPQVRRVVDRRVRAERCRVEAARDIPAEEERQHGEVGRQRRELGQEHGAREAGEAEAQQAVDQQVGEVADRQQQRAGVGDEGADEQVGQGLEAQPHGQGVDDRGEDEHGHVEREEGGDRGPEEEEAGVEPAPRAALGRRSQDHHAQQEEEHPRHLAHHRQQIAGGGEAGQEHRCGAEGRRPALAEAARPGDDRRHRRGQARRGRDHREHAYLLPSSCAAHDRTRGRRAPARRPRLSYPPARRRANGCEYR